MSESPKAPVSTLPAAKKPKFSKEEELLLQDYSRNVTTKSSALFYANAAIVSAIPIWIFWRIHQMEPTENYIFFIIGVLVSTYLVSFAYKNVKLMMKHKIALKRDQAINAEVSALLGDSKKYTKKDREDRIQWTKSEVSEYEATTFSIFYNNCLFLAILLVASFFMFKNFTPAFNYFLSMGLAAGLAALFSTSSK